MLRNRLLLGFALFLLAALIVPAEMKPLTAEQDGTFRLGTCHAQLKGDLLIVGNGEIERQWRVWAEGSLEAVSLRDLTSGREWIGIPAGTTSNDKPQCALTAAAGQASVTEEPSLLATLRVKNGVWTIETRLQVFAAAQGILMEREAKWSGGTTNALPEKGNQEINALNEMESFKAKDGQWNLTRVKFLDQTDRQAGPLVIETKNPPQDPEFAPEPMRKIGYSHLRGNLFFIEDKKTLAGLLMLKHAPLPDMRPMAQIYPKQKASDMIVIGEPDDLSSPSKWFDVFCLRGNEITSTGGQTYRWVTLAYSGGRPGRIAALQTYYRQLRKYDPARDGLLLTNTWGDRSKDGRVREDFMKKEIDAAERLGVDVIEVDDGWQKGTTMNSVNKGGVWNGFYAKDADFWQAHPERLPHGIKPLADLAKSKGMQFGLWFAPDSSNDFANWQKDRDLVLGMHRERGVGYFKFDGIKMHTRAGEANVHRLVGSIVEGSQGRVTIDLDVTAEVRPGYFGIPNHGPIFVENRYTDMATANPEKPANAYWPHRTLRNFWLLAQYVDPVRLRMEFLNNSRNVRKYKGSPLAPANYEPDYLFATVMFGSPLGWFETQNLPPAYFEKAAPLIKVWKAHREAIFNGSIIPVGEVPDGKAWTGLVSVAPDRKSGYALVFRELNEQGDWAVELPLLEQGAYEAQVLAGAENAKASVTGGKLNVVIPEARRFVLVKIQKK